MYCLLHVPLDGRGSVLSSRIKQYAVDIIICLIAADRSIRFVWTLINRFP